MWNQTDECLNVSNIKETASVDIETIPMASEEDLVVGSNTKVSSDIKTATMVKSGDMSNFNDGANILDLMIHGYICF